MQDQICKAFLKTLKLTVITTLIPLSEYAWSGEIQVAVAANFSGPAKILAAAFEEATGDHVTLSSGSTGMLYAQIKNGAPYDAFLAADSATPARLVSEGLARSETRFTYAIGKLVLWSTKSGWIDSQGSVLRSGSFTHLSICDPKLAPYGAAAVETLQRLNLYDSLGAKLVRGENITQAYQFVLSGNAELGFVALSQVIDQGHISRGSAWIVPTDLYSPLRQDAILLNKGKDNQVARSWFAFLHKESTKQLIRSFGYDCP